MKPITTHRSSSFSWAGVGIALVLAACAARPREALPPAASPERALETKSVSGGAKEPEAPAASRDEARSRIADSERELEALLPESSDAATPGITPPAPAPPPGEPRQPAPAGQDRPMTSPGEGQLDRCAIACKAFGSMRRAADRLCELTGDDDSACSDARSRVARSGARVRRSCPSCAAAQ